MNWKKNDTDIAVLLAMFYWTQSVTEDIFVTLTKIKGCFWAVGSQVAADTETDLVPTEPDQNSARSRLDLFYGQPLMSW